MKYVMKDDKKSEILHSSVYAQAQSGENIGAAAGGIDVAKRNALEKQRKFVKGYRDSSLMQGVRGVEHAKKFVPREAMGLGQNKMNPQRIVRQNDAVRGQGIAVGGERSATGMRSGTPRGQQPIARGGYRNR